MFFICPIYMCVKPLLFFTITCKQTTSRLPVVSIRKKMGGNISYAGEKSRVSEIQTKNQRKPRFDTRILPALEKSFLTEIKTNTQWKSRFNALKDTNKLMVVYFKATWCGPCKSLEPKMKEFAAIHRDVVFLKVDVDVLMGVAMDFSVCTLPAVVFLKRGKEVDRVVGLRLDEIHKMLDKHTN